MGQDIGLSLAEAPAIPADSDLREELADLETYLRGLPPNLVQAGLFNSYELWATELLRRIEFEAITALSNDLAERLDGGYEKEISTLDETPTYANLRNRLDALCAAYDKRTHDRVRFARSAQAVHVVFAALLCIGASIFPNPITFAGLAIGNLALAAMARWFEEKWRSGFDIGNRLRALRDELAHFYGPDGDIKSSFQLYRDSHRCHDDLFQGLKQHSKKKWFEPRARI